ncbi:MAG: YidB family protein [Nevskia sp.]|nr:YidB family protein [Nevskia sp.]
MGLLDQLAGSLLSGALGGAQQPGQPGQSPLLQAAMTLIQQNGGLPGLLSKFQQSGLGQQAESWVSSNANLPISAEQLHQVLGSGAIAQIASQLGMDHGQVSGGLAQLLPQLINQMTPNGSVPANHADLLSEGLALLAGRGAGAAPAA